MDESADSSESIDLIGLRSQIPITKSISKGYDQSSTLEQLKKNAHELFLCKDKNISLEADLKIAKETIKLHQAELAFQKKEYEAEIKSLKQNLDILQKGIAKNDTGLIDLSFRNQNDEISNKYLKWKKRAKSLKLENKDLHQQNEKLKQELTLNQERNTYTEIQNEGSISDQDKFTELSQNDESKQKIESLKSKVAILQKENSRLQSQVNQMKLKYESKEFEIQTIKTESEQSSNSIENLSNQIIDTEGENQKLRSKVERLSNKNQHLENEKDELMQKKSLIDQIKSNFHHLCDIFGLESLEIEDDWNPLIAQCEKILKSTKELNEIKNQNITLQKRLTTVMNGKKDNQTEESNQSNNDNCEHLLNEMEDLKNKNNQFEKLINECAFKEEFSRKIINIYSLLVRQIDDIHDSVFGSYSPKLRPVVLAVIFAKRFISFSKNPTTNDGSALNIFAGRILLAADSKLSQIKEKLSSLTYELVHTKEELAHYSMISRQFEEDNDQTHNELENSSDQLSVAKKKIKFYKYRMIELQEELSTLIPKDLYDIVIDKLSRSKQRNQILREENSNLQKEIEKHKLAQKEMRKELKQVTWESSQKIQDYDDLKEELISKTRELETFQIMLSEKNKEVLALERLISREKNKSLSKNYHVFSTKYKSQSSENSFEPNISQDLDQKQNSKHETKMIAVLDNTATDLASIVNPEFLK